MLYRGTYILTYDVKCTHLEENWAERDPQRECTEKRETSMAVPVVVMVFPQRWRVSAFDMVVAPVY